jgi:hypothetical protein
MRRGITVLREAASPDWDRRGGEAVQRNSGATASLNGALKVRLSGRLCGLELPVWQPSGRLSWQRNAGA